MEYDFKEQVFEFLDNLRKSGETNMFGATPFIQREFGLPAEKAKPLLVEWMKTFDERHPVKEG